MQCIGFNYFLNPFSGLCLASELGKLKIYVAFTLLERPQMAVLSGLLIIMCFIIVNISYFAVSLLILCITTVIELSDNAAMYKV